MIDFDLARENLVHTEQAFADALEGARLACEHASGVIAEARELTASLERQGRIAAEQLGRVRTVSTYANPTDTTTDVDVMLPETRGRYRDVDGDLWERRGDGSVRLIRTRRGPVLIADDYVHNHGPYTPEPWVEVTDPAPRTLPAHSGLYLDKQGDLWLIDTITRTFACMANGNLTTKWSTAELDEMAPFAPVYISLTPPTPEQVDHADH